MGNPGASAPSSYTVNYDALLSTTLANMRNVMVDNIFASNAYLAALRKYDGIRKADGGERIKTQLMYEKSTTTKSYRGYDIIPVIPQDGITSAFFEWCEIADTITISRREERQNSGEAAQLNLLEQKIKQIVMSIKAAVNVQLVQGTVTDNIFTIGNDGKDLSPLGYFYPKDVETDPAGDNDVNVGNISRATYDWWRPNSAVCDSGTLDTGNKFALSVSTWKGLSIALKRMYNYCSRGADGSAPNIALFNQETFEQYESGLDDKIRYMDTELADMGFDTIRLKACNCIWDELVPNVDEGYGVDHASYASNNKQGTVFFVNTKFHKLVIDKESDFITTPFVERDDQTARTAKMLFMGQVENSNPRKGGVCYAISNTIAA